MSLKARLPDTLTRFRVLHAALAYALLSLVVTWPLVLHFDQAVIGDMQSDVWKHVWGFWWMRRCLVVEHALPLQTTLLNYPYGGSLFFIDPLGGLLSVPLQSVMGPVAAYNMVVLFNLVLAATAAFALARRLTHSAPAAFAAGVIFGFSPYLLSNITSGISESFNVGWIPLFILFYTRALREHENASAVKAGLALGVATIGCWYYGAFCVMYAFFFFFYELVRKGRAARRLRRGDAPAPSVWVSLRPWVLLLLSFAALEELSDAAQRALRLEEAWPQAVFSGASMLLVIALLVRARQEESPPPSRLQLMLRLFAQTSLVFAIWSCGTLLRLPAEEVAGGVMRQQAFVVLTLAAIWASLTIWARNADEALAGRLVPVQRLFSRLLVIGLFAALIFFTERQFAAPFADPESQEVRGAWLGIAWLWVLWVAAQARDSLQDRLDEARDASRPRRPRGALRTALPCALTAVLVVYVVVPPASLGVTMLLVGGVWAALMLGVRAATFVRGAVTVARRRWMTASAQPSSDDGGSFLNHFLQTVFKRALVVAIVSGAVILPVARVFKSTLNNDQSLVFRVRNADNIDLHLSERFHNISRLADYVAVGKKAAVRTYTVDRLTRVSSAGFLVLLLAMYGAVGVRRRDVGWWGGVAVVAVTLSLGPFLYVTSDIHLDHRFPPYMWLYDWFPFFSQISIPFRFDVLAMLAFSMLSAFTLASWMRGRPSVDRLLCAWVVSLAVVIEVMFVSPAPFPVPLASAEPPGILARLAAEPGGGGLLDIPVQRFEGELLPGEYFYYQTVHGKSIPNRVEGEIPTYVFRNRFMLQLFHLEHDWPGYPNDNEKILRESLNELREFKFRYLVVHESLLRAGAGPRLHALLHHFLGAPRFQEDGISVYDVESVN